MSNLALITDKDGNIIGQKDRHSIGPDDCIAISNIMLENSRGELLIAKRSLTKKHDPGLWSPSAAGTVEPGETFLSNIIKETEEELGVKDIAPREVHRMYYKRPQDNTARYAVWYWARCDLQANEFVLQKEEVEQVRWVSKQELLRLTSEHPEQFVGWPDRWKLMVELTGYDD